MPEDNLYRELAIASVGFVTAPAGCGKTEAIIQSVKNYCNGKQLILTHTNAGLTALRKRFKTNEVSSDKFHIDTISGWALSWVSKYPTLSNYEGNLPIPTNGEWSMLYRSASVLLQKEFVKKVILNSYSGVIVDEYQDCTFPMHELVLKLVEIIPTRILGDPLQGIFSLNADDPLVDWETVTSDFINNIGTLSTPFRWNNVMNPTLGQWLIESRSIFEDNRIPILNHRSILQEQVDPSQKAARIQALIRSIEGSICIIGPKHGNTYGPLISSMVNAGVIPVEPNDLPFLKSLIENLSSNIPNAAKGTLSFSFLKSTFAGLEEHKDFIEKILTGNLRRPPIGENRRALYQSHGIGYSFELLLEVINYIQNARIKAKKPDSIRTLKRILERHQYEGISLQAGFTEEILKRKFHDKGRPKKCFGSTLLLKGLEFDHAIILYNSNDNGWSNVKDFYVALTRGSKSIYIIQ